jgi:peptide methionine sulfoxide reductase msrA/msrB
VPSKIEAVSGYTGGRVSAPSYRQVSSGTAGHVESVKEICDPTRVDYARLLEVFWTHVNPTDPDGQCVDRGEQFRSLIFYADQEQKRLAEDSKRQLSATDHFDQPIVTDIPPLGPF